MTVKNCGPLRSGNRMTALCDILQPQSYRSDHEPQPFCELHHRNIVAEFPSRCPLATPNPLTTLGGLQDAAYRELGCGFGDDADHGAALDLLDQLDTCSTCIDANMGHRTIRRLRRELGVSI